MRMGTPRWGRRGKRRFTIDHHGWGERKTSHQGKTTKDEQEEH
jgi:hypothetical protein